MKSVEEASLLFSQLEKTQHLLRHEVEKLRIETKHSYLLLENIVSSLPCGLIVITAHGGITQFNPYAATLLEKRQEEVIGKPFHSFFSDTLFGFSVREALNGAGTEKKIFLTLSNGKQDRELEVSLSFLPKKSGLVILLHEEIQKRVKETIQRSDRLKELGEMAASFAHEIRNPLGGIEGFASLLLRDLEGTPKKEMAQGILEGTRLLNRLVTQVLDFARPFEVHFARHNLQFLLEEIVKFVAAEGKKCHLLEGSPLFATIDKDLLEMALLNLIHNAFEASSPSVEISLKKEGSFALIVLKDQGEGILQENIEKIFSPFFTTKAKGTGLGLAEAHKVIAAQGGTIEVVSKVAQGSTFTIKLPLNHAHC